VSTVGFHRKKGDIAIVFGTPFVLDRDRPKCVRPPGLYAAGLGFCRLAGDGLASSPRSSERRRPMGEPRAQSVTGFNFAMWSKSSSSVAQPMKYRQTIS
jgi:hypothetical protein